MPFPHVRPTGRKRESEVRSRRGDEPIMRVEIKDMMFMIKIDKSVRGLNERKDCFLIVNETQ